MSDTTKISFAVRDVVHGEELSPDNTTLPMLSDFVEQVMSFLRGSGRPDLNEVKASIKKGSLAVVAENETGLLTDAFEDYNKVMKTKSLDDIDPARARIMELWQNEARRNQNRDYRLYLGDETDTSNLDFLSISSDTDFKTKKEVWVDVEMYVYGHIYDLGGKSKPNVHIELENGKSIKIGTKATVLTGDNENRLYKDQLVRIKARQNVDTKELKDERLIAFEHYNPVFDEDEFEKIAKKTKFAWKSIDNVGSWVENLRGSSV
jgi:hypothetical protein